MKKSTRNSLILLAVSIFVMCGFFALVGSRYGNLSIMLPMKHKPAFTDDTSQFPGQLHSEDNTLAEPNGQTVILRGVMAPDPAILTQKGWFDRDYFNEMATTGANVLRLAVDPERWEQDPDYLWRYLDPAVRWNGENGLYVIIDLHFIGDIGTDNGSQMPDIGRPSKDFAIDFWQQVALYFKDTPHVIFEIFNEPADISAKDWQMNAQNLVDAIRATGAQQLIIIGGTNYSRDLSWVLEMPINDDNVAYAAHIYPVHSSYDWDHLFGSVSEKYPVVITEWGWMESDPSGEQPYLVGSQITYGEPLMTYLYQHGIGWVACWYDDEWQPAMFEKGTTNPTTFGRFVLDRIAGQ